MFRFSFRSVRFTHVSLVALLTLCLSTTAQAQQQTASFGVLVTSLSTASAGAVTGTAFATPGGSAFIVSWQVISNGSALSATLEGSADNTTWGTLDTQTGATGGIKAFGFSAARFLRISQVSRTGGTLTTGTMNLGRGFLTSSNTGSIFVTSDTGSITFGAASDAILVRDTADTLAMRRGTNGQTLRIYGTYTDASNYERLFISSTAGGNSNVLTEGAGTGFPRNLNIGAGTGAAINFMAGGSAKWILQLTGMLIPNGDNLYDIGASGANRPRTIYVGTDLFTGGNVTATGFVRSVTYARAAFFNANASSIVASGATIAITNSIHHISGTVAIDTITVPASCVPTCNIFLIPDAIFTTTLAGNIGLASTAVIGKVLELVWDGTKWWPSY